jgi:hypothetical protein
VVYVPPPFPPLLLFSTAAANDVVAVAVAVDAVSQMLIHALIFYN